MGYMLTISLIGNAYLIYLLREAYKREQALAEMRINEVIEALKGD